MVIADADGRIVHWNDAAERFFGYTAAEAVGQPVDLIVPEDPLSSWRGRVTLSPVAGDQLGHPPLDTL